MWKSWRFHLSVVGFVLLPGIFGTLFLIERPGSGPGWGGGGAAAAAGMVFMFSLWASPFLSFAGFLIGSRLDKRKATPSNADAKSPPTTSRAVTTVAVFHIFFACTGLLFLVFYGQRLFGITSRQLLSGQRALVLFAGVDLIIGIGLLRRQPWARPIALIINGYYVARVAILLTIASVSSQVAPWAICKGIIILCVGLLTIVVLVQKKPAAEFNRLIKTDDNRTLGSFGVTLVWIVVGLQTIYGVFLITLRFVDLGNPNIPPSVANLPFVIMGAPFLLIAWALWQRRRWGLWMGLAHTTLLPVTIAMVSPLLPDRHSLSPGSGWPGLGEVIIIVFSLPFFILNALVFTWFLLTPRVRHWFERRDSSSTQWSLQTLLAVTLLAAPVFTADYFVPSQQIEIERAERVRREEQNARAKKATDEYVQALVKNDETLNEAKLRLLKQDPQYVRSITIDTMLVHPDKRVRLEATELMRELDVSKLGDRFIQDPKQFPQVRNALLRHRAKSLNMADTIRNMQNVHLSDRERTKAAQKYVLGFRHHSANTQFPYLALTLLAFDSNTETSVNALALVLNDSYQCDAVTLRLLLQLEGPPGNAVRHCLDSNYDRNDLGDVAGMAALLLVRWGIEDEQNVEALLRLVRFALGGNTLQMEQAQKAIDALASLGAQASPALPQLRKASTSADSVTRAKAKAAIDKISKSLPPPQPSEPVAPVVREDVETVFSRWLSRNAYQQLFNKMVTTGHFPARVEGKTEDGEPLFRAQFKLKPPRFGFISFHGISTKVYQQKTTKCRQQGFRELSVTSFVDSKGTQRFSGTLIKGGASRNSNEP